MAILTPVRKLNVEAEGISTTSHNKTGRNWGKNVIAQLKMSKKEVEQNSCQMSCLWMNDLARRYDFVLLSLLSILQWRPKFANEDQPQQSIFKL